jgi:hypothetical protein
MQEMDSTAWQRMGSSIVWSPELLADLIKQIEPTPLRAAIAWLDPGRLPDEPPGGHQTILIGGLQAVLDTIMTAEGADTAYQWLRDYVLRLVRMLRSQWDRVGVVFVMDGPSKLFKLNEADDLVYFGKSSDREKCIRITLGIWNGASSGNGAYQLIVPGTKDVGGFHVKRIS